MGLFDRFAGSLLSKGKRGWLGGNGNPFLHTLHLKGVADPLDPSPLWSGEFGGGASVREAASGHPGRRLRAALDAHRFMASREDEFGRVREDRRVFTDVLIRVPETAWQGARFSDSLRIMQDELTRRHEEDFQDHLLDARVPRYVIVAEPALAEDEVLCQFGLGVFLPDGDDRPAGEVRVRLGEREAPLPPWRNYDIGSGSREPVTRPAALYRGQKYLLIARNPWQGAILSPLWPEDGEGYAVVHCDQGRPVAAEWAGEAAWELTPGPVQARFANGLTIEIEREEGALDESPDPAEGTLIFTGETTGPRLSLTALALPRFGPAAPGLGGWTLRLNRDGSLDEGAAGGVTLQGKSGDSHLYWSPPGQRRFTRIQPETRRLDCGRDAPPLELVRSFPPDYLCLLKLPLPLAYPLPKAADGSGVVIGAHPAAGEVGIRLKALNQPGSLQGPAEGLLNALVSRRFARLSPEAEGLRVELLSQSHPLQALDRNYHLKETLQAPGGTLLLRPGEHLQLALYILRYDAGN